MILDEAHKFFDKTNKSTLGLVKSIIYVVRNMRHMGIRVIISTQSPLTIAPELFELASIVCCHRFHSKDWFDYISTKIPLPCDGFEKIKELRRGEALIFSSSALPSSSVTTTKESEDDDHVFVGLIRKRITADKGATKILS